MKYLVPWLNGASWNSLKPFKVSQNSRKFYVQVHTRLLSSSWSSQELSSIFQSPLSPKLSRILHTTLFSPKHLSPLSPKLSRIFHTILFSPKHLSPLSLKYYKLLHPYPSDLQRCVDLSHVFIFFQLQIKVLLMGWFESIITMSLEECI